MAVVQNEARASYVGIGRREIIETTFWTLRPTARTVDPLAQTFMLGADGFITSIGLFFLSKDTSLPVTVEIRNVVNGYPGREVLATATLRPEEITCSATCSVETKAVFNDPFFATADTEYCFVVLTNSSQYRLGAARLGGKDMATQAVVARQPYTVGVMFSSSNAVTWTAHQELDLKFRIYGAKFKESGVLDFKPVSVPSISKLLLAVAQITPRGSRLDWQVSPDGGVSWQPLANGLPADLRKTVDLVKVRALFSGDISAVAQYRTASVMVGKYKLSGVYVSRAYEAPAFSDVTVYVDMDTPSGTTQTVKYTVDDGVTWTSLGAPVSSRQADHAFVQHKYTVHLASPATKVRIKIEQTTNNRLVTPRARRLIVLVH